MLKKRYLFLIMIICLFAVSAVSAADNATDDIMGVDEIYDNIICSEVNNYVKLNDSNFYSKNLNNSNEDLYSIEKDDVLCYNGDEDVLGSSPPHSAYSVGVSDTTISYGSSGNIVINVNPSSGYSYTYDFYLKVYDSENNLKINKRYYSTSSITPITYSISANQLSPGIYTIKLVNYADGYFMDTAELNVLSNLPHSAYSVDVSDTTIEYGAGGSISMSISPSSSSYNYKYDFYLKVYNSRGSQEISQRYFSSSSSYSKSYNIGSHWLQTGSYTIKIINCYDGYVMDTANLYVVSVPYSAYSVSVVFLILELIMGLVVLFLCPFLPPILHIFINIIII